MNEPQLRAFTKPWPGVGAGMKWEDDLVFTVAGKMFCVTCIRGPHEGSISFKVEDERFLELTERPGFIPAPYLARAHWVQIATAKSLPATDSRALIRRSYELVRAKLPKKTQRELAD
ncbi:MAG TPA: MmcQ/YjbR family DNA-binding protein [Lysobacter sp.]|nr:MmcQ/YjbR family DNA-binding protein [Lysobacter sp.]